MFKERCAQVPARECADSKRDPHQQLSRFVNARNAAYQPVLECVSPAQEETCSRARVEFDLPGFREVKASKPILQEVGLRGVAYLPMSSPFSSDASSSSAASRSAAVTMGSLSLSAEVLMLRVSLAGCVAV